MDNVFFNVWNVISGCKTYILLAAGGILVLAHHFGLPLPPGIQINDQDYLNNLWLLFTAAAVRHGFPEKTKPVTQPSNTKES
jgi:hypothetical protein